MYFLISLAFMIAVLISCAPQQNIDIDEHMTPDPTPTEQPVVLPTPSPTLPPPDPTPNPSPTPPLPTPPLPTPLPLPSPTPDNTSSFYITFDITNIPYYGNRSNFRLSAEHALAYAEAIRNAKINRDGWGPYNFDSLYPVLIDVSGDGVPLLLLLANVGDDEARSFGGPPLHPPLLYGFENGEIQKIVEYAAIGIMVVDNNRFLSTGWVHDFGGGYDLYRINNGAAEFDSTMGFSADVHTPNSKIHINGREVSIDEYWEEMKKIPTIRLIDQWHPGNTEASPLFIDYLVQPITREDAMQIFIDHAAKQTP